MLYQNALYDGSINSKTECRPNWFLKPGRPPRLELQVIIVPRVFQVVRHPSLTRDPTTLDVDIRPARVFCMHRCRMITSLCLQLLRADSRWMVLPILTLAKVWYVLLSGTSVWPTFNECTIRTLKSITTDGGCVSGGVLARARHVAHPPAPTFLRSAILDESWLRYPSHRGRRQTCREQQCDKTREMNKRCTHVHSHQAKAESKSSVQ